MATDRDVTNPQDWPVGWDAHRRAQLREVARLSPAERLEWLEEAIDLALRTGALERALARRERG